MTAKAMMVQLRVSVAAALLACGPALAQRYHSEEAVSENLGGVQFSPNAGRTCPTHPLWGDQHLHTEISVDAGTMCRLGQETAYCFARGEEVTSTTGVRAKLSRPLNWLVISGQTAISAWPLYRTNGGTFLAKNRSVRVSRAWLKFSAPMVSATYLAT